MRSVIMVALLLVAAFSFACSDDDTDDIGANPTATVESTTTETPEVVETSTAEPAPATDTPVPPLPTDPPADNGISGLIEPAPTDPPPVQQQEPPAQTSCDPSYPDFCLAPGIGDLDCGDVPYARFTVYAPDPHGFDGNFDGVGCESN